MDWKLFATVFGTVFLAELGDKTQLATLLYSADRPGAKWVVFGASASALVIAAGIGVMAGSTITRFVEPKTLQLVAGMAFILVGAWTIKTAL